MNYDLNWGVIDVIPHYTGFLSMVGSGWIIGDIVAGRKFARPYHRIILALCIFDFLASFWYFMASWAKPEVGNFAGDFREKEFSSTKPFRTNQQVCEVSGFTIQLAYTAIPAYNVVLSMQYLLYIRYNWSDQRIQQDFERYAHAIVIPAAFILAVIPWPLKLYNPFYFYCWVTKSGFNEETGSYYRGSVVSENVFHIIFVALVLVSAVVVTAIMVTIFCTVRSIVQRSNRYSFPSQSRSTEMSDPSRSGIFAFRSTNVSSNLERPSVQRSSRSTNTKNQAQRVARMAVLYTIPFYLTWVIPTCFFVKDYINFSYHVEVADVKFQTYIPNVYIAVALPLQGFFNCFVYMLPRFEAWVQEHQIRPCQCLVSLHCIPFRKAGNRYDSEKSQGPGKPRVETVGGNEQHRKRATHKDEVFDSDGSEVEREEHISAPLESILSLDIPFENQIYPHDDGIIKRGERKCDERDEEDGIQSRPQNPE